MMRYIHGVGGRKYRHRSLTAERKIQPHGPKAVDTSTILTPHGTPVPLKFLKMSSEFHLTLALCLVLTTALVIRLDWTSTKQG